MAGFYERRKSRAALWCFRLAVVSAPFLLLTVLLHRYGSISTQQSFWLFAFAIAMLVASLLFGMRAIADLWEKGYKGGRATVNGITLALLLLTPFGIQFFNAVGNPALNDVSSDVVMPPPWLLPGRATDYEPWESRAIVRGYSGLVTRRYNAPPERVLAAALQQLDQWDWQITASRNIPENQSATGDGEGEAVEEAEALEGAQPDGGLVEETSRGPALPDMIIQARATTLVMKLPSQIVLRLSDAGDSTLVDMRSASDWSPHDFGINSRHVADFLKAMDDRLAGVAGEI